MPQAFFGKNLFFPAPDAKTASSCKRQAQKRHLRTQAERKPIKQKRPEAFFALRRNNPKNRRARQHPCRDRVLQIHEVTAHRCEPEQSLRKEKHPFYAQPRSGSIPCAAYRRLCRVRATSCESVISCRAHASRRRLCQTRGRRCTAHPWCKRRAITCYPLLVHQHGAPVSDRPDTPKLAEKQKRAEYRDRKPPVQQRKQCSQRIQQLHGMSVRRTGIYAGQNIFYQYIVIQIIIKVKARR